MQLNTYLIKKMPYLAILSLVFGLYSCGSYQYVGVDNDGIYGSSPRTVQYEETVVETPQNSTSNYYQNYFKNKSLETEYMVSSSDIFTDVDSYESGNYDENISTDNTYQGYGGWGQTNSNVTINYIDNGLWNDPFLYGGWGWNRWNNIGWNRWNNIGWNGWNNWGWNAGFYDPFWGPQFYGGLAFYNGWGYGGYYGNPYRNGYYGNNRYYNRSNVAYSASRRGSNYSSNSVGVNNNTYSTSRRGNYSTNSGNISKYGTSRRSSINTTSPSATYNSRQYNSNGTRVYSNTQRRTTYSTPSANSTTRSSSTVRRSSGSTYTPSNSNNSRTYSKPSSNNSTYTPSRSYTPSPSSSSGSRSSSGSSGSSRGSGSSSGGGRRG